MSKLSSVSIRRPVLASVMSIIIIIFGLISYSDLGVREYPVVDPPVITISTTYTGANADVIEREITEPVENQVNAVSGIRTLTSISQDGRSEIRAEFSIDTDLEVAANDVRDRVSRAVENIPPDANPPSVRKEDADSDPIVMLNISSEVRDRVELTQIARNIFREQLRTIDGISIISTRGQQRPAIRLWMDPDLMAAYDVSPMDISSAISMDNIELPSGVIEGDDLEMSIRTLGRLESADEFNSLILREEEGALIRFHDIGEAEMGTRDDRSVLKRDGEPMIGVAAIPQPGSNQIQAADELFERVDQIKQDLPDDIEVTTAFDNTEYIRESISDVQRTLLFAFGLVVCIIFLFLRDFRTTFIPIIVVPITLIGAFFVMNVAGFSLNVLTLLALILAIGLVVDDAIIVLENIYSKMEKGLPAIEAGITGTKEIFFVIIATSLSLVSVFTPILFLEGVTGRLFREFGVVMIGAVLISSFVALTLTPMLSTKFLKLGQSKSRFYEATEPFFKEMTEWYRNKLEAFLERRHQSFWILGGTVAGIIFFFLILPEELAPIEDRSSINISVTAPEGATFSYMDDMMDQVTEVVNEEAGDEIEVLNTETPGGATNTGDGYITLKHPSERPRSQMLIADELGPKLNDLPGAEIYLSQPQSLTDESSGLPVQFVVQAPDPEYLRDILDPFLQSARNNSAFSFVDVDLNFNRPELAVEIDRDRARSLGVSVQDIAETLQLAYSGSRYGEFTMEGRQYWVMGMVYEDHRSDPSDLLNLRVRSSNGDLVTMDNLVNVVEDSSPPELYRFNRLSSATFSAALAEGYSIADGITAMRDIADSELDESMATDLSGPARDFEESVASLHFIFLMAVLFIYLILAAQFESFRDPLIILVTVPLALLGALFSLWYFGETLNIFSNIAMIMLIGLVTKNGILIVEFANQRQQQGLEFMEAIKDAAVARFRPILMTSCSTIFGILPLTLSIGAGAESRIAMGVTVIGGLIVGTFLSLFIIPAMYSYFASDKHQDDVLSTE